MSRRKKVALALLAVLALSQAPFVYRRLQLDRLRERVRALEASRLPAPPGEPYEDFPGVFHVHTSLGGHSPGKPEEVVAAARANRLAFVVMTEHPSSEVNTAEATLKGTLEGVIFVNGSELVAAGGERLFVAPGFASPAPAADRTPVAGLIERAGAEGKLSALGYPEQVRAWDFGGFDAMEVYNLFTNTKSVSYPRLFFDALWSYRSHPDLLFATFYERPEAALRKWDELNAAGGVRLAALAGNDSHANVGFRFGGDADEPAVKFYLDPYERSFRVVRNRVLLPKGSAPTAQAVLEALRAGRSYIGFDIFGDTGGFRFTAARGAEEKGMGEEIALDGVGGAVRLSARAAVKARFVFFRNGRAVSEARDTTAAEMLADEGGAYRVEVYADALGGLLAGKPWIISNPIYVR